MARKRPPPEIVYKYYGPDRAGVFDSFLVRFSQLAALNDPFEFLINAKSGDLGKGVKRLTSRMTNPFSLIGLTLSAVRRAGRDNEKLQSVPTPARIALQIIIAPVAVVLVLILYPFISRQMQNIMSAAAEEFEQIIFNKIKDGLILVFSCSETWDSVPMWAHYAANHTGFVVGIDPSSSFINSSKKENEEFLKPRRVQYLKKEPRLNPLNLDVGDFIASKMDHWSYEKEWRFTGMPDDADERGSFVSGQELLLYRMRKESIKEIVFGAYCSVDTVTKIFHLANLAGISPNIFQVQRNTGYGFKRVEITQASDIYIETRTDGPVANLREQPLHRMEKAFEEFHRDAKKTKLTSWLVNK
jgi:hypothetical protein